MTRQEDGQQEYSNSEIQSYMDCRRRWWLSYYRRLRPRQTRPVGPMSVGSRVHRALEEGYSTPGREDAARAILAASIEADWQKASDLGVEQKFMSEAELCLIMIEGFFDWAAEEGLDAEWEVVAHERVVKSPPIEIAGELVVVKGKLDQTVRRLMDGSMFMRDWKTTVDKTPVMLAFKPQLKTYLLLLALTEPAAQVSGGQFVFLRRVKRTARAEPPFYFVEPLYVGAREMESFWTSLTATLARMVETSAALDAGADPLAVAPARPTRDCSWRCPFYACCDMFDDGSDAEGYLAASYEQGDPYEYYGLDDKDKEMETG